MIQRFPNYLDENLRWESVMNGELRIAPTPNFGDMLSKTGPDEVSGIYEAVQTSI